MALKHYIPEWITFYGYTRSAFAKKSKVSRVALIRICDPKYNVAPRPSTINKITKTLHIRKEEIYMHPADRQMAESRSALHGMTNSQDGIQHVSQLEDWLRDPQAEFGGKRVSSDTKLFVEELVKAHISLQEKR